MRNEIYYFTGTGNSLSISKELAKHLGGAELISISNVMDNEEIKCDGDTLGMVVPIYFWNLPEIVERFVEKLRISKDTYLYVIINCGVSFGGALHVANNLLKAKDNVMSASFVVNMPDNSIMFPTKEEGIPKLLNKMPSEIESIASAIKNREKNKIAGNIVASKTLGDTMKFVCKNFLGFNEMKLNTVTCSKCGLCESVCPVDNISLKDGSPVWGDKCEMCFACIHYCPKQSITYKKQKSLDNYQIVNADITINEIKER